MCRNTEMFRTPPPPFGTCATIDFGGAPKKKVSECLNDIFLAPKEKVGFFFLY